MKEPEANRIHTIAQAVIFRAKASVFQLKRGVENLFDSQLERHLFADNLKNAPVAAESKTPLWTEIEPEEQFLLAGKVHNLRLAVKKLNGLEIPANEIFSFWKHLGRADYLNGYVVGRELREGCVIPNVGGGLCQLSNALYDAALQADFEIVERHAHTRTIRGSLAEKGRDATVFWNYVDLRFRSANAFRIELFLGKDHLTVKFRSENSAKKHFRISGHNKNSQPIIHNSCATCGVESCFRSIKAETHLDFGKTAYLIDEFSPEFDEYIQKNRQEKDVLFVPLDGKRFKKANYAWTRDGFSSVKQSCFVTARRSYKSRKLSAQGAERQKILLEMYEKLAESYAKNLNFDVLHLVVQQNLLPSLWRKGVLGGRTFDVLMNVLPMTEIQKKLDYAASLHPESATLSDFRAGDNLIEAEAEALQAARTIITPHTAIASKFSDKSEILNWKIPPAKEIEKIKNNKLNIVFPASTVGRKGCYELREAVRGLDVKLIILGAEIEGANFWRDFETEKNARNWLEKADLVVLPAFVEHRPRRLLEAIAHKIPVIATKSCGIENIQAAVNIEAGNVETLRALIGTSVSPKN